ncbi:hypothetical protein [Halorubrum trueperi]|uniref:DUF8009 domain-containing protein n=1 Tax=Halorubrum trueperi TaxID=2004704 RepID=A0ABD5UMW5_9EURY
MTDPDPSGNDGNPPDPAAGSSGPGRLRSIAVHREDVASALEATLRTDHEVVLRVTPPFSGRMRARLHSVDDAAPARANADEEAGPEPICIHPRDLVADVQAYPEVDETAAKHPDADVETHRRVHGEAVEAWRERVRDSIVESVALDVDDGPDREVDVNALG